MCLSYILHRGNQDHWLCFSKTHYLFHVYILPLLYVASLMCYASHICCAGQPAVLLCALHYVGSGPVLIYIR